MSFRKVIPAAVAVAVALGAAGAATVAHAASDNFEGSMEIATILAAKASISDAIAAAEGRTGGRAVRAEVEHEDGAYLYRIKTAQGSYVTDVTVDPKSGAITRSEEEGLIGRLLNWAARAEYQDPERFPVSLKAAIAAAEARTGGKAVEARARDESGRALYLVEVANNTVVQWVKVDARDGAVIGRPYPEGQRSAVPEGPTRKTAR